MHFGQTEVLEQGLGLTGLSRLCQNCFLQEKLIRILIFFLSLCLGFSKLNFNPLLPLC